VVGPFIIHVAEYVPGFPEPSVERLLGKVLAMRCAGRNTNNTGRSGVGVRPVSQRARSPSASRRRSTPNKRFGECREVSVDCEGTAQLGCLLRTLSRCSPKAHLTACLPSPVSYPGYLPRTRAYSGFATSLVASRGGCGDSTHT